MGPRSRAERYLERALDPAFAIGALDETGALIGVAGFKTAEGAFLGGGRKALSAVYGPVGGVWRGLLLSALERPVKPGVLLMDGVMVAAAARGQGVGVALLTAIKRKAAALGCDRVRLDVVDGNPRAKALYLREGFVVEAKHSLGPLRRVFGFRSYETMIFRIEPGRRF